MKNVDVLVIGGSAAGIVAATTGKTNYPDKSFLVIRKEEQVLVPCGIPYIFGSLPSSEKNLIPDTTLESLGIDLKIGKVIELDLQNKTCQTNDGDQICFDKLVIATGSEPHVPSWLDGKYLQNVFTIPKNKEYLDHVSTRLEAAERIVVVGGGFIGVELADELNKRGKQVTIVEQQPHVLALVFDTEIAAAAETALEQRGVSVACGSGITALSGMDKVSSVTLENGSQLKADAVILSMGYKPNTKLASAAGLATTESGALCVDEYMRTSCNDVFAVGDCAEKVDFITRKSSNVMLASTACAEARTAGMNLYGLSAVKTFSGSIAIFATALGETGFGAAGLTEEKARAEGFQITSATFTGIDKHPETLPGTHSQTVKLIATKNSGVVLGGEVVGGLSTGELTNIIGFIIQNRMTVSQVMTTQIGTHPLLSAPPTAYPLIKAAEAIVREINQNRGQ